MIQTLEPPIGLALPLEEVKASLKIVHSAEDALLMTLIRTAESFVGEKRGHYGLTRTLLVGAPLLRHSTRAQGGWPSSKPSGFFVVLPLHPIQAIEGAIVRDIHGKRKELLPKDILWTPGSSLLWPPKIFLKVWDGEEAHLRVIVGYGAEPEALPATLRYQILSEVGRLYEKRGSLDQDPPAFPRRFCL